VRWSFAENIVSQVLQFSIAIALARLLVPKDFGLIGMLSFFIVVSESFIDGGFSQALIRDNTSAPEDYSTVFFYNIAVGLFLYCALFGCSGFIGGFFAEPRLVSIVKVLGLGIVISSFSTIQRTLLTKDVNFKLQTKITILSSTVSGIIGIGMAFLGWGVWSLVWKKISEYTINTAMLWVWNGWRPTLVFDTEAFRKLFKFGSKLLVSGLLNTTFNNAYSVVIGKWFSATDLGYYNRAAQFGTLPPQSLTYGIQRVSFPVLASVQNDKARLKRGYKNLIKNVTFISFAMMIGLSASAKVVVLTFIGDQWLPVVPYLRLMCFLGMMYPLHAINLNMLTVLGRSDRFLKLEIIKKILVVPALAAGIYWGIKVLIIFMCFNSIVSYYINSYWSGSMIDYRLKEQIVDILPSFALAVVIGIAVWSVSLVAHFVPPVVLLIQTAVGLSILIAVGESLKMETYFQLREIVASTIIRRRTAVQTP